MDPLAEDKVFMLLQLGRAGEAERAARELIAAEPESFAGYFYLAQALLNLDRYAEGWEISQTVMALAPNWCPAHTQRSNLLQNLGRFSESVEAAETAVGLDHENAEAHLRLANALSAAGRENESAAVSARARRQFPEHCGILYFSGLVALGKQNMDAVAEAAEPSTRRIPGFTSSPVSPPDTRPRRNCLRGRSDRTASGRPIGCWRTPSECSRPMPNSGGCGRPMPGTAAPTSSSN